MQIFARITDFRNGRDYIRLRNNGRIFAGLALLFSLGVLILGPELVPSSLSWLLRSAEAAVAAQPVGTALGSYNGVIAYSNGSSTAAVSGSSCVNSCDTSRGGVYLGWKWQCVEYVRRYYYSRFGLNLATRHRGDARTWYDNAGKMGLQQHPNGGTVAPMEGDILTSNTGRYGHIAIVRSVTPSQVCVIQQNLTNDFGDVNTCLTMDSTGGRYAVRDFPQGLTVRGWLRRSGVTALPPCAGGTSVAFRVNGAPPRHPNGTLIKLANDPTYFVLRSGQKRGIPSPEILQRLYDGESGEFEFNDVITVAQDEFDAYSTGAVVTSALPWNGRSQPDGKLIKAPGQSEISIVSDGQRRPFPDAATFVSLGYLFCNVTEVPDYASYPVGPMITAVAVNVCNLASLSLNSSASGSLTDSDCSSPRRIGSKADLFTFNATAGQRVTVTMNSTAFDTYVYLLGPGNVLLTQDDDSGGNRNSRINDFTLPSAGTYTIEATSYDSIGRGSYFISVVSASAGVACSPVLIGQNTTTLGSLNDADCTAPHRSASKGDLYRFNGTAGQRITLALNSTNFDPYLFLTGPSNTVLREDDDSGGNLNSRISNFVLPVTGTYIIEATAFASTGRGPYSLVFSVGTTVLQTVFLIHGENQSSADLLGLKTSLHDTVYGLDRDEILVDAGYDWSECAATGCSIQERVRALASYILRHHPSGRIVLIAYGAGAGIAQELMHQNYNNVFDGRPTPLLISLENTTEIETTPSNFISFNPPAGGEIIRKIVSQLREGSAHGFSSHEVRKSLAEDLGAVFRNKSSMDLNDNLYSIVNRNQVTVIPDLLSQLRSGALVDRPERHYQLLDVIAYIANEQAIEILSNLAAEDPASDKHFVGKSLDYAFGRENPFILAYRVLERISPEAGRPIGDWAKERLTSSQCLALWADAALERYQGIPSDDVLATDPITSRVFETMRSELRLELAKAATRMAR